MMGSVKQAVIEMILLGLLSTGLAFGVNAVRRDGHIKPTKNYFEKGIPSAVSSASKEKPTAMHPAGAAQSKSAEKTAVPTYNEISLDGVVAILNDPETARGLNVFIDARKDEFYAEGHIPGAIRCFPYEIERCINKVLDQANGAEKVIVYCGGEDCEDSIFLCRELVQAGVPAEAVYLYPGGWKEWSERSEPVQTGAEN